MIVHVSMQMHSKPVQAAILPYTAAITAACLILKKGETKACKGQHEQEIHKWYLIHQTEHNCVNMAA